VTVAKTKPKPRAKPATAKGSSRNLKAAAEAAIRAAEAETRKTVDGGMAPPLPGRPPRRSPRKPLRYRAIRHIPKKRTITRGSLFALVGTGELLAGGMKLGAKGGMKFAQATHRVVARRVRADMSRRTWVPAQPRTGTMTARRIITQYSCCGKRFTTIQGLNTHHAERHKGEARRTAKAKVKIQRGHTRRTAGKVVVRPAVAGGGRHRQSHRVPSARRVEALLAAHGSNIRKITEGVIAMSDQVQALVIAANGVANMPKPRKLAELRSQAVGLERAFMALGDAIQEWRGTLVRRANIDPSVVNPFTLAMTEELRNAGTNALRLIVAFDDVYALQIRAASGGLSKPDMDLSETA
jgi:hypothetical protein